MINEKNTKAKCCEPIENIEGYAEAIADTTQTWDCHHRLEIQGEFTNSVKLLKRCGMYWHRPACELIFLKPFEHSRLHRNADKSVKIMLAKLTHEQHVKGGKAAAAKMTPEQRSKAGRLGGKAAAAKMTFEQRSKGGKKVGPKSVKIMLAKLTFEQRSKGGKNSMAKMTPEQRSKAGRLGGEKTKGKLWWNNGVISKRSKESPGVDWKRGRLSKKP